MAKSCRMQCRTYTIYLPGYMLAVRYTPDHWITCRMHFQNYDIERIPRCKFLRMSTVGGDWSIIISLLTNRKKSQLYKIHQTTYETLWILILVVPSKCWESILLDVNDTITLILNHQILWQLFWRSGWWLTKRRWINCQRNIHKLLTEAESSRAKT